MRLPELARGLSRALAFIALTLTLVVPFILVGLLLLPGQRQIRCLWCRLTCRILGLQTRVSGQPFAGCATLFVANHVSYLDICVIGSYCDAAFVAKAEVASWPLFGFLGRLGRTMFVRRYWRDALIQRNTLAARLRGGENFVLFAEGTSTNGLDVLPLKTSLLSVAEPWVLDRPVCVQPLTLRYLAVTDSAAIRRPMDAASCELVAWFGEISMLPHLWRLLRQTGAEIELVFGEPVISWSVSSRKELGARLREEMRSTLLKEPEPVKGLAPAGCPEVELST